MPVAAPIRTLYLVAYDIADPARLNRVLRLMKGWKVGGQKSFCECWLTPAEQRSVLAQLAALIDPDADRIHLFSLDPRMTPRLAGIAVTFSRPIFSIV
jgi:CRISPR-associated protein Cas2